MPDVFLDGVKIEFPEPVPTSFSEGRAALEEMLAAQGRVLVGMWLDGQPFDESLGSTLLATANRVDANSLALAEALAQAGAALAPEFAALRREVDELANSVVRVPWREAHERCVPILERVAQTIQRAVDVVSLSGEGSARMAAVTALADAVERWMAGIQQQDAAAVCLLLDGAVLPALERVAGVLQEGSLK